MATNWLILGGIAGLMLSQVRTLSTWFKSANKPERRAFWRFVARLLALIVVFLALIVAFAIEYPKGYLPLWTIFAVIAAWLVLLVALIYLSIRDFRAAATVRR
jgi:ABC-type polysaccharide/polyol phosphate export permease